MGKKESILLFEDYIMDNYSIYLSNVFVWTYESMKFEEKMRIFEMKILKKKTFKNFS